MDILSPTERLIKTIEGKEIDRIATFDIMHNIPLIEHLSGEKINNKNAEDLLCRAASKSLDMIRHFAVPDFDGTKIVEDEDGFAYRYEWWTGQLIKRPDFKNIEEVIPVIEKDIENIYNCIDQKKICPAANQHVNLFYEKFEYFEEVKEEYRRISNKLDGTVMMGPEMVQGIAVACERYDYKWWTYLYYDYQDIAVKYLDALYDYELSFIDSFADFEMCPFANSSESVGLSDRLLFPYEFFKEIIIPREKKVVERWKKHNTFIFHFLDGYKWPVLDDYFDLGTDVIFPFEPYVGMDIIKFRGKYPEAVVCQPIDCTHLLTYGTRGEIKKAVIKAIEDADKKKIIIGSTSEINPDIDYRNALMMYETARNYKL
ncbi:uroporphyrinogen decarboxylase family protein [Actinomycetota bacterium]